MFIRPVQRWSVGRWGQAQHLHKSKREMAYSNCYCTQSELSLTEPTTLYVCVLLLSLLPSQACHALRPALHPCLQNMNLIKVNFPVSSHREQKAVLGSNIELVWNFHKLTFQRPLLPYPPSPPWILHNNRIPYSRSDIRLYVRVKVSSKFTLMRCVVYSFWNNFPQDLPAHNNRKRRRRSRWGKSPSSSVTHRWADEKLACQNVFASVSPDRA